MAKFEFKTNLHEILTCNLPCVREEIIEVIENKILEIRFNEWNDRCSSCFRNCNLCQFRCAALTDRKEK